MPLKTIRISNVREVKGKMGQLSFLFVLLIIGGYLIFVGSVRVQQFQLNPNISPLHTDGKYIKDGSGNIIFLRGIDKTGFLDSPDGWWQPEGSSSYLDGLGIWNPNAVKAHLDAMQSWGLSVIRIVIGINYWITNDTNYRQNLRDTITWAGERGMYVILAPWAVVPADGQDRMPFPPYTLHPEIMTSEQDFVDFWVSVARELKDLPNVLFELYNEPIGFVGHNNVTEQQIWFNVAQRCVDAIRLITDQIVIIQWGHGIASRLADLSWVQTYPINGTNIVYSTHIYRLHGSFGSDNPYNYTTIKQRMTDCKVNWVGETLNKPLIIGEIGADLWETGHGLEHELEYFNNTLTILNEWDLGYAVWEWFISAVRRWGILDPNYSYVPPPNEVGQMLINAIKGGSTIRDIIPPIANAGPNQTVNEDTLVTFNGSASWDNVGIKNYIWTFMDVTLQTLIGVNPNYTFNNVGDFEVTLNVTDAAGNWNTDVMWVYVSADNFKPFIDAPFHDPEIPDDNQTVTVLVNVTDAESGVREVILSYSINEGATWINVTMNKTSGAYKGEILGFPTGTNVLYKIIACDNANNSHVSDNEGQYYVYIVIPEFATTPTPLLLMIVTLVATTLRKLLSLNRPKKAEK